MVILCKLWNVASLCISWFTYITLNNPLVFFCCCFFLLMKHKLKTHTQSTNSVVSICRQSEFSEIKQFEENKFLIKLDMPNDREFCVSLFSLINNREYLPLYNFYIYFFAHFSISPERHGVVGSPAENEAQH